MSYLIWTIDFVSDAPIFDIIRLWMAVFSPESAHRCGEITVAIFHPVGDFFWSNNSSVIAYTHHRNNVNQFAKTHEFVQSKKISTEASPSTVRQRLSVLKLSNTIVPMIATGKVSAWPPDHLRFVISEIRNGFRIVYPIHAVSGKKCDHIKVDTPFSCNFKTEIVYSISSHQSFLLPFNMEYQFELLPITRKRRDVLVGETISKVARAHEYFQLDITR